MENETQQGEQLKDKSRKKVKNKSKQATVLKQLNNQNLYPLQERIGIYVVAALSVLGILLIVYSGVMSLVSNADDGSYDTTEVEVDIDEVNDMLEDLDNLLDDDSENSDQNDQFAGQGDNEDDNTSDATTGVINDNVVNLWREPENVDALLTLHEGDEVTIVDFDYNAYWAQVEVETDVIDGTSILPGFILKEFIDVEE